MSSMVGQNFECEVVWMIDKVRAVAIRLDWNVPLVEAPLVVKLNV